MNELDKSQFSLIPSSTPKSEQGPTCVILLLLLHLMHLRWRVDVGAAHRDRARHRPLHHFFDSCLGALHRGIVLMIWLLLIQLLECLEVGGTCTVMQKHALVIREVWGVMLLEIGGVNSHGLLGLLAVGGGRSTT